MAAVRVRKGRTGTGGLAQSAHAAAGSRALHTLLREARAQIQIPPLSLCASPSFAEIVDSCAILLTLFVFRTFVENSSLINLINCA